LYVPSGVFQLFSNLRTFPSHPNLPEWLGYPLSLLIQVCFVAFFGVSPPVPPERFFPPPRSPLPVPKKECENHPRLLLFFCVSPSISGLLGSFCGFTTCSFPLVTLFSGFKVPETQLLLPFVTGMFSGFLNFFSVLLFLFVRSFVNVIRGCLPDLRHKRILRVWLFPAKGKLVVPWYLRASVLPVLCSFTFFFCDFGAELFWGLMRLWVPSGRGFQFFGRVVFCFCWVFPRGPGSWRCSLRVLRSGLSFLSPPLSLKETLAYFAKHGFSGRVFFTPTFPW